MAAAAEMGPLETEDLAMAEIRDQQKVPPRENLRLRGVFSSLPPRRFAELWGAPQWLLLTHATAIEVDLRRQF